MHCPLFSHPKLASRETVEQKRLAPEALIYRVPTTLPMGFSSAMFFCQDVTDHCTLAGSAESPLFVCRRCSAANMAWDRLVSVGRLLTIWGFWARGENCTNVHLARLVAGLQKAGLDIHNTSRAKGSADVLRL